LRQQRFDGGGIVHAFSGGVEEAKMYAKLGFKLGIGGSVTYEQAKRLHNVIAAMPIESLVIETDAPDMIPQPYRNPNAHFTRNSPAYLPCIAQALATSKQLTLRNLRQYYGKTVAKHCIYRYKATALIKAVFYIYPRHRRIRFFI
jgi:TatD DNase family protein